MLNFQVIQMWKGVDNLILRIGTYPAKVIFEVDSPVYKVRGSVPSGTMLETPSSSNMSACMGSAARTTRPEKKNFNTNQGFFSTCNLIAGTRSYWISR